MSIHNDTDTHTYTHTACLLSSLKLLFLGPADTSSVSAVKGDTWLKLRLSLTLAASGLRCEMGVPNVSWSPPIDFITHKDFS